MIVERRVTDTMMHSADDVVVPISRIDIWWRFDDYSVRTHEESDVV